jgi:hypothetical protein
MAASPKDYQRNFQSVGRFKRMGAGVVHRLFLKVQRLPVNVIVSIFPLIYHKAISFREGLACVTVPDRSRYGTKGFVNSTGEMVIEPRFQCDSSFHEGWAWVECNGMNQIIDRRGTVIWESPIPKES